MFVSIGYVSMHTSSLVSSQKVRALGKTVSKILSALTFPESKNKNICNPKLSLSVRKPKNLYA